MIGTHSRNPGIVILTWLATRLILAITVAYTMVTTGQSLEEVLSHWDVLHFQAIASDGYAEPTNIAFFPGLPLILKALDALGLPTGIGGAVLAQSASILAAWALYRMFGSTTAALWLLAPMTIFTAVAYTEAFFCAAAFWAWERASANKWRAATILACFACALRISGAFLLVGLAVLALTQARTPWRRRLTHVALLVIPGLVIVGYLVYIGVMTGSLDAWYTAQNQGWQRNLSWPWDAFRATVPMTSETYWPGRPEVPIMFRFEIASVIIGYLTVIVCLIMRRWADATWVAANVIPLSSSGWFLSVNRAVLLWFPLFMLIARVVEWEPGRRSIRIIKNVGLVLVLAADVVVMMWWTWLFGTGQWAS